MDSIVPSRLSYTRCERGIALEEREGHMWRWLGILVVLGLVCGCTDMWRDTADFFDSGFADDDDDDDDDDGDGGDTGELTLENLNGSWELDVDNEDTTISNNISNNTLLGSWEKDTSEPEFLSPLIGNFTSVTTLTIRTTPQDFTFSGGSDPFVFTWVVATDTTIRLTPTEGNPEVVQAKLEENGTKLTLTDDENRTAVFNFPDDVAAVTSGSFEVDADQETCTTIINFRTTTANPSNTLRVEDESCTVVDADTLQLSSVEVRATLSSDENTLTLNFPADDPNDRGPSVAVFTR
jgi:hypothetical protein